MAEEMDIWHKWLKKKEEELHNELVRRKYKQMIKLECVKIEAMKKQAAQEERAQREKKEHEEDAGKAEKDLF